MSDLIYSPPEAEVNVPIEQENQYYVVAKRKFFLLSILTFGLYFVYWFYRNWRLIKERDSDDSWPPMRGLFYIFFTHSLFTDINEAIKTAGKDFQWSRGSVATATVVVTILTIIISRMSGEGIGSPATDLISSALIIVLPIIVYPAQKAINFCCDDVDGSANSSLGLGNWIWIVVGSLFWLMVLLDHYIVLFAPEMLVQ